jgi:Domain of unknown function (DUF1707)
LVSHYHLEGGDSVSWQHRDPDLARPGTRDTATLASDGDRDAAVRMLNEAFAEGRLTADEHGERVRAAFAARTWQELARLTADLPGPAPAAGPPAGAPGGPDRRRLCALLICCPPAGIAWLLAARHRARTEQRHAVTAAGPPSSGRGDAAVRAGVGWHAEDR